MEATCPACIGVTLLAQRVPALAELTEADPVSSSPDGEPKAMMT